MAQPKVVIIGGSLWGNRGAAAMLETSIGKIREINPTTEFIIFTPYPNIDSTLIKKQGTYSFFDSRPQALIILNFQSLFFWILKKLKLKFHFPKNLNEIVNARIMLDVGGITFADGRLKFLPYNILTILPALLFNIPVVKISQAAGSFNNLLVRNSAKIFLPKCDFVFARGEKTKFFLEEIGMSKSKVALAMDAAFVYEESFALIRENKFAIQQICEKLQYLKDQDVKIVGISPSILVMQKSNSNDSDYLEILINIIRKCSYKTNIHFIVFPNASREGSKKKKNNDILAIETMRDKAEKELPYPIYKNITWISYDVDTYGINEITKKLNALVTSRFHAMVFGLRLVVPTLVIGWSHKYFEVMKVFHQENHVYDYKLIKEDINNELLNILSNEEKIHKQILEQLPKAKELSQKQFDYLKRFLD